MNRTDTLIKLNAKADQLIQFGYYDEEEERPGKTWGGAAATVGVAGAGYGGYKAHKAISERVLAGRAAGDPTGYMGAAKGMAGEKLGGAYASAKSAVAPYAERVGAYAGGLREASSGVFDEYKTLRSGVGRPVYGRKAAAGGALKALLGRLKGVRFEGRTASLVELNAKADALIEFRGDLREDENLKGQTTQGNVARGAIMGGLFGGGIPVGAVQGAIEGGRYAKAGAIYKKRDPVGHGMWGGLAAIPGGGAGYGIGSAIGGPRGGLLGAQLGAIGGSITGYRMASTHTLNKRLREQEALGHLV